MITAYTISVAVISIIIQSSIFYYVYNLEAVDCKCILDWRHNFIKFMCVFSILLGISSLLMAEQTAHYLTYLMPLLMVLGLINTYCVYTYVGDLQSTNCLCATERQPNLNKFLYYWRYFMVFCAILSIISIVMLAYIHMTHKPIQSIKSAKTMKTLSRSATLKAEL